MSQFKKFLAFFIIATLFSTAVITSCGKKSPDEAKDHPAGEHPAGEHPADSTKSDSTEHPVEHPADSTKK